MSERPQVNIEMRDPVTPRMGSKIHGALVLSGRRHGRPVTVRRDSGEVSSRSEVTVRAPAPAPEFEAEARDGQVRPAEGAPDAVAAVLASVPNSTRWKRVKVEGGTEGIVVSRKGGGPSDWLCDLWLAERLASA